MQRGGFCKDGGDVLKALTWTWDNFGQCMMYMWPVHHTNRTRLNLWLTCHVEDAITGTDVGQEGISQALASMSPFY